MKRLLRKVGTIVCATLTFTFALIVLGVMIWAYVAGFDITSVHMLIQILFAFIEHRRMGARRHKPCTHTGTVGIIISAEQEDPEYLHKCLTSVRMLSYPKHLMHVIMVVDGNSEDDLYMMEMFKEVFADQEPSCYIWQNNYHTWNPLGGGGGSSGRGGQETGGGGGDGGSTVSSELDAADRLCQEDPQRREVEELIQNKRCVCIIQKGGGKREVMYTAFKALGSSVDYIQVCDSDTKLDPLATCELVKVLESNQKYGAVGGEVMIHNEKDSYISFMSSLDYWMAFNIERSCQSFFDCVSCISGPLGLYRNDLLQQFLESWYNQKFLCPHSKFGDDRRLTNHMLSMGYATKYTRHAKCYTKTPSQFLRWLNQRTRSTKSYFREWLFNAMWWHKHHPWMTYESILVGIFPFFVTGTIIELFWTGTLWDIIWMLCCIQLIGLVKAAYACLLRRSPIMVFMSLYSALDMTSLLPAKYFAIINKSSWGTSGRKKIVGNYIPLLPLSIWAFILLGGLCYTVYRETQQDWGTVAKQEELKFVVFGSIAYVCYWALMVALYWICVSQRGCQRPPGGVRETLGAGNMTKEGEGGDSVFFTCVETSQ